MDKKDLEKDEKAEKVDFMKATKVNTEDPKAYPFQVREVAVMGPDGKPLMTDGKPVTKRIATPEGFDADKHERLGKGDFATNEGYCRFRGEQLQLQADEWFKKAEGKETGGAKKQLKTAKKLKTMMGKMDELRKMLAEQGVDVTALLASIPEDEEEKPETK